jgi:hypothetical protein
LSLQFNSSVKEKQQLTVVSSKYLMKRITTFLAVLLLSGCAGLMDQIPSFNDANQSRAIIDVRLAVEQLDCDAVQEPQVKLIRDKLDWFRAYSESKSRQADVLRLTDPIAETVKDFYQRVSQPGHKDNKVYCQLKKRVLTQQTKRAAEVVIGRF